MRSSTMTWLNTIMVRMTNLYAQREKGNHGFSTDITEMRLFLAMLLLSGYAVLPRRKMYWENADDVFNKAMSDAMLRNRFEEILSVFHLADNQQLDASDSIPNRFEWVIRCGSWLPVMDTLCSSILIRAPRKEAEPEVRLQHGVWVSWLY